MSQISLRRENERLRQALAEEKAGYEKLRTAATRDLLRLQDEIDALKTWRADVTVALQHPGGVAFEDVPTHIRTLVASLATLTDTQQEEHGDAREALDSPDGGSKTGTDDRAAA